MPLHIVLTICLLNSLPRSRFLDVTQRSPQKFLLGGALRDIQKTAARETIYLMAKFTVSATSGN